MSSHHSHALILPSRLCNLEAFGSGDYAAYCSHAPWNKAETLGYTLPSQQDASSDGHPAERLGSPVLSSQVHTEELIDES